MRRWIILRVVDAGIALQTFQLFLHSAQCLAQRPGLVLLRLEFAAQDIDGVFEESQPGFQLRHPIVITLFIGTVVRTIHDLIENTRKLQPLSYTPSS